MIDFVVLVFQVSKFLNALTQDGGFDEQSVSLEQLDRIYGPLKEQVAQSLQKQDAVLSEVKVMKDVSHILLGTIGLCMKQCKKVKFFKVHPFHVVMQDKTCTKTVLCMTCVRNSSPPTLFVYH